jgi:uncharacterized protein (TIGR01777 family)
MKILITGATGFIGLELTRRLSEAGNDLRVLSRNPAHAPKLPGVRGFAWNPETSVAPATALEGVDVVYHLAGENVGAGRWSDETKRRIVASRELGTRNLVAGINLLARKPVFISASAVGFYGNSGDTLLSEESPEGPGFLAHVCEVWEHEARQAKVSRLVTPRFGVVLGSGGGAMAKLLPVFRAGVGGRVGDGKQWMSWIHREDVVSFLVQAATDSKISGIYNLVGPEPARNETFAHALGHVLHRPSLLPVPAIALKLALGEMAEETILASQRVSSAKLAATGFIFRYPTLEGALQQIVTA